MKKYQAVIAFLMIAPVAAPAWAVEKLHIGDGSITPGINARFGAETRDTVIPANNNLPKDETNIHLEAQIHWAEISPPKSALRGEFVPYLNVSAHITDDATGKTEEIKLTPHLSADDGMHYAKNVKLPGTDKDRYDVTFTIAPPEEGVVNFHSDWVKKFGTNIFEKPVSFTYKNLDFSKVIHSTRQ